MTCRRTVAKIVLIGNLRCPPSCLCLLYFPTTVLFTCIKSWFFRNHLANFDQIPQWSFYCNVIDSLFKWSCSIDYQANIFFFKTKNYSNDDIFISCDDRIGKMLHNICMSAVAMSLRWASRGQWASSQWHITLKWRRINVDATWSRRIDVDTTSFWCVPGGLFCLFLHFYFGDNLVIKQSNTAFVMWMLTITFDNPCPPEPGYTLPLQTV